MFFSGIDSQLGRSGDSFYHKEKKNKVLINQRFVIKKIQQRNQNYNLYEGIDLIQQKFVSVYVKPLGNENFFSKSIKEDVKEKLAPPTIWTGTHKIEKHIYLVEVHQKLGPTLGEMFKTLKKPINQRDFIHLFYQMIKLVQRISVSGYVHRQLSPSTIVFDSDPKKNELYILNTFSLKKKNQQCGKITSKYCSKGSHLGLNANSKDDFESICYVLLDIYSQGNFLANIRPNDYESNKTSFNPKNICSHIPAIYMEFYHYVLAMNYSDEINYFHWKNLILKNIPKETITRPYSWMVQNDQEGVNQTEKRKDKVSQHSLTSEGTLEDIHEDKENIEQKVIKFHMAPNVNSMKSKLKNTIDS